MLLLGYIILAFLQGQRGGRRRIDWAKTQGEVGGAWVTWNKVKEVGGGRAEKEIGGRC